MRLTVLIVFWLVATTAAYAAEASKDDAGSKVKESQGLTLEDIGRGLKSAAKNIEQEIPKMGAAIGNAVKKVTEKDSGKSPDDKPAKPAK